MEQEGQDSNGQFSTTRNAARSGGYSSASDNESAGGAGWSSARSWASENDYVTPRELSSRERYSDHDSDGFHSSRDIGHMQGHADGPVTMQMPFVPGGNASPYGSPPTPTPYLGGQAHHAHAGGRAGHQAGAYPQQHHHHYHQPQHPHPQTWQGSHSPSRAHRQGAPQHYAPVQAHGHAAPPRHQGSYHPPHTGTYAGSGGYGHKVAGPTHPSSVSAGAAHAYYDDGRGGAPGHGAAPHGAAASAGVKEAYYAQHQEQQHHHSQYPHYPQHQESYHGQSQQQSYQQHADYSSSGGHGHDGAGASAGHGPSSSSAGAVHGLSHTGGAAAASNVSEEDIRTIFRCARHNRTDEVAQLLDRGIPINVKDKFGNTLLCVACQNGLKKMAKLALRRGADINARNYKGNTPLHFCYTYGYGDTLGQYLISKGADPNIRNHSGYVCFEGLAGTARK